MSSRALLPTVECKLSKVLAAACLTSGKGSHSAFLSTQHNKFIKICIIKGQNLFTIYKKINSFVYMLVRKQVKYKLKKKKQK